jgi:hypothetical protein
LILPSILAVVLAAGLTLDLMGRSYGSTIGPWWLRQSYLSLAAIAFVLLFVSSLWKTLKWGKESDEYAALLKKEEEDEARRRRHSDSE